MARPRPRVAGQFRSAEVLRLARITHRQMDYWARIGLVVPSIKPASGCGSDRLYSYDDVVRLAVCSRLREAGVELGVTKRVAVFLLDHPAVDVVIVANGIAYDGRHFRWPMPTPVTLSVPVVSIRGEVERRVDTLIRETVTVVAGA